MIPALVVAVLALAALAFVLMPLLRGPRVDVEPSSRADEAEARKRAALSALVDLETDHEIGKLSTADFEMLRLEYEREALAALAELDAVGAVHIDEELEAEIASMKSRLVCPNCGELRTPGKENPSSALGGAVPCPKCQTTS